MLLALPEKLPSMYPPLHAGRSSKVPCVSLSADIKNGTLFWHKCSLNIFTIMMPSLSLFGRVREISEDEL